MRAYNRGEGKRRCTPRTTSTAAAALLVAEFDAATW